MDAAEILPYYTGIIVHDCRASYWKYEDVKHAICCAHLLRKLNGIIENHPEQTWAVSFKNLLLEMKKVRDKAVISNKDGLSYYYLHKFDTKYDSILKTTYKENPLPDETPKKRGRKKKNKVSGCFRNESGANEYLTIMSCVGTARKHGINAFTTIREALNGNTEVIFG